MLLLCDIIQMLVVSVMLNIQSNTASQSKRVNFVVDLLPTLRAYGSRYTPSSVHSYFQCLTSHYPRIYFNNSNNHNYNNNIHYTFTAVSVYELWPMAGQIVTWCHVAWRQPPWTVSLHKTDISISSANETQTRQQGYHDIRCIKRHILFPKTMLISVQVCLYIRIAQYNDNPEITSLRNILTIATKRWQSWCRLGKVGLFSEHARGA